MLRTFVLLMLAALIGCAPPGPAATVAATMLIDDVPGVTDAELAIVEYVQSDFFEGHGETYPTPFRDRKRRDEVSVRLGDPEDGEYVLDIELTTDYTPAIITGGIIYDGEKYDLCQVIGGWEEESWYDREEDVEKSIIIRDISILSIDVDLENWGVARDYENVDGTDGLAWCSLLVASIEDT